MVEDRTDTTERTLGHLGTPRVPWEARWLPVDDIQIDKEYQRDEESAIVRRLTERFNADIAGPLRVSERADGSLWVMDGQHRLQAIRALGQPLAYCYVERARQKAEARTYVGLNGGTKAQAMLRFKAALIAGDDTAVIAVEASITAHGFIIDYETRSGDDPRLFRAVQTALTLYRKPSVDGTAGPDRLTRVLSLARETWPDTPGAAQSVLLKAFDALFLNERIEALNRPRFVRRVGARLDPGEVAITAHERSRAHGHAADQWALNDMVEVYNKDLRDAMRRLANPIPMHEGGEDLDALDALGVGGVSAVDEYQQEVFA